MDNTNFSVKHIGSLLVMYLSSSLKGVGCYVKEEAVQKHGTKYVILDFKKVETVNSNDIEEIMDTYHALKKANLYLCCVGEENKHPHKMLRMMGITRLPGIEIRQGLEETVIEIAGKI